MCCVAEIRLHWIPSRQRFVLQQRPSEDPTQTEYGRARASEPDWAPFGAQALHALQPTVQRCLGKDPRERLRDIGDAAYELRLGGTGAARHDRALDHGRPARFSLWRYAAVAVFAIGDDGNEDIHLYDREQHNLVRFTFDHLSL